MEIKILDHITETQVTNIIEASGGRHILKTPGTLTLVATVGSEVVGFIELERMETVTLIYAKPGNIQVEVFASLLDAVERIGLNRIILHPSATSIAFFKSFGYHEVGNGSLVKILPKRPIIFRMVLHRFILVARMARVPQSIIQKKSSK